MPLPELIEIQPLQGLVHAQITVPGSKSITNRALILAALARGQTTLRGALWSEDTQVMVEALQKLGFELTVAPDAQEACNRTISVTGLSGKVPKSGTAAEPLEIFVGNAGTAARFLAAFVCLGKGVYRLHGSPRMHERPQSALFQALRELGYGVDSPNDKLPAVFHSSGPRSAACQVSIRESSQFASALLLCAKRAGWSVSVIDENPEESPYVTMTTKLIEAWPKSRGSFEVEPDASSGSYFVGASWLLSLSESAPKKRAGSAITVRGWPTTGWQKDQDFTRFFPAGKKTLPAQISRTRDLGDSIMTGIVLAPFASHPVRFTDLARLRLQECERVAALRAELTRCGSNVVEHGDTLIVCPSSLHGATIETYNDHRMAMAFSILGLKVPGIQIKNPACVRKTFPNFFQKLAAPPASGLGATIQDAATGRPLPLEDLFAQ